MRMTKLIGVILSLTVAIFFANGFAENLPIGAIARIDTGQQSVNAIAYSRVANRLAVATAENIHIYDMNTYKELMVFVGHTDSVLAVAFSPNGKLLVSASSDETVRLWNADTGKPTQTLEDHTGPVNAVAFSADGKAFFGLLVTKRQDFGHGTQLTVDSEAKEATCPRKHSPRLHSQPMAPLEQGHLIPNLFWTKT